VLLELSTLTWCAQQIAGRRIITIWGVGDANNLVLRTQIAYKESFEFDVFVEEIITITKLVGRSCDPKI
jgi:hypothetical protein